MIHNLYLCIYLTLALVPGVQSGASGAWGYNEANGPDTWKGKCQDAYGRQSPIDIRAADIDYAPLHRLHFINYDHPGAIDLSNVGTTLLAQGYDKWHSKQPMIQGGGLKHRYKLAQFHIHWAQNDAEGSEHTLGSLHYPAELHLVHVREGLTVAEAKARPDGLAVVGVFFAKTNDPVSSQISALADHFRSIEYNGNKTEIRTFRTRHLLPYDTEAFYRYEGSLTTPDCDESVIWTVLAEPISITAHQLKELRMLRDVSGEVLKKNYRPTQPINGRRILYRPSKLDRALICSSTSNLLSYTFLLFAVAFFMKN